jgi:hypothetical protein
MTFSELARDNADAIVRKWLDHALATYADDAAAAFGRRRDRFENPVGHSLREGTREIFRAVLDGMDEERIRPHLLEIIRIRAIQQFSPSQAVGFVFLLKDAVRDVTGAPVRDPACASELAAFDSRVDRLALMAFDVYTRCRERFFELRVNELKRQIPWAVSRLNRGGGDLHSTPVELTCESQES